MCVITDENNIIVSISLIRGLKHIPEQFNVYEYVELKPGMCVGERYVQ